MGKNARLGVHRNQAHGNAGVGVRCARRLTILAAAILSLGCLTARSAGGGCPCNADVNGNGVVDVTDVLCVLNAVVMGDPGYCPGADVDCDGAVTFLDLEAVMCAMAGSQCCPAPEPHGACCFDEGLGCSLGRQEFCEGLTEVTYTGDGIACEPDPCFGGQCCDGETCIGNYSIGECLDNQGGTTWNPNESCPADSCACAVDEDCNDGNACTVNRCIDEACDFSEEVACSGLVDQCNTSSCDPNGEEGNCVTLSFPDGTPCDDGVECSQADRCIDGSCGRDCNENAIPDDCDVPPSGGCPQGTCSGPSCSGDCNENCVPDECESDEDCNGNGENDSCDIANGTSQDINGNGIPDECELHACCFMSQGYPACMDLTLGDCAAIPGVAQPVGVPCPTEDTQQANHDGMVIIHVTDPAQTCGGDDGRGRDDCIPNDPIDAWTTNLFDAVCHQFGIGPASPAIPGDFFELGSDQFGRQVCLRGQPLGPVSLPGYPPNLDFGLADTLVRRLPVPSGHPSGDPFDRCEVPSPTEVTVLTEVVALSLVSTSPITVTSGMNPPDQCDQAPNPPQCVQVWCAANPGQCTQWDVAVTLSQVTPPPGWIVAEKTHCNGGTYTSELNVQPKFTFTKVSDPTTFEILDTGLSSIPYVTLKQDQEPNPPWTSDLSSRNWGSVICTDFHPAILDTNVTTDCDWNVNQIRDLCDIEDCLPGDNFCRNCNENEWPDGRELAGNDCNGSGILDECELEGNDCQDDGQEGHGVPDECDIAQGTSQDCSSGYENSIPDECEFDCNLDGIPDSCAIASGSSTDLNGNGIADDCEPQEACNDCNACDDDDVCTKDDLCDTGGGSCQPSCQIMFADATDNGVVNTSDVLACNGAIPGGLCAMPTCDVKADDGDPPCTGNGVINTADVLAINGAIGQPDPCNCSARDCP